MINETPCEFPLVDSGLKTVRICRYGDKLFGGLASYKKESVPKNDATLPPDSKKPRLSVSGGGEVWPKFTMNFSLDTLRNLIEKFPEIEEALNFFQRMRQDQMKLKNQDVQNHTKFFNLKENQIEMFQFRREGSTLPTESSPQYWWESLAQGEAIGMSHRKGCKHEVFKSLGMMPNPYELTRDAACLMLMFSMYKKKKGPEPCVNCQVSGGLGRPFPCHECFLDGLEHAADWVEERRFAQLFESEGFEKRLAKFMEFLRVSLGSFKVFGQHLAKAFKFYQTLEDLKYRYIPLFLNARRESYFLNLTYGLIKFERASTPN